MKNFIKWLKGLFLPNSKERKRRAENKDWSRKVDRAAKEYLFNKGIRKPTKGQMREAYRAVFKQWFVNTNRDR